MLNGHGVPVRNGPLVLANCPSPVMVTCKLTCAVGAFVLSALRAFTHCSRPRQYRGTTGSPSAGAVAVVHVSYVIKFVHAMPYCS